MAVLSRLCGSLHGHRRLSSAANDNWPEIILLPQALASLAIRGGRRDGPKGKGRSPGAFLGRGAGRPPPPPARVTSAQVEAFTRPP
jgi:hypothetical protein